MEYMTQEQVDFANMIAIDIQQPRRWVDVVRYGIWPMPQTGLEFDDHYESDADEDRPTEPWEELQIEEW